MLKITVTDKDGLFNTPEEAMVAVVNKALRIGLGVPSGDINLIQAELMPGSGNINFRFRKFNLTFLTHKFADNNIITEFGRKFANAYMIPYEGSGGNAWGASTYLMGSRGHYFTIRNEAMAGITVLDLGSTVGEEVIINVTGWGKLGSNNTNASMMIQAKGEALIHASSTDEGGADWPANTNVIYRSLFTPSTTIVNSANKDGYVLVPYKPSNSTFKSSGDILVGCGNYLALSSGYVSIGEHGMAVIPDPQLGGKLVSNTYLFMEDKEGNS